MPDPSPTPTPEPNPTLVTPTPDPADPTPDPNPTPDPTPAPAPEFTEVAVADIKLPEGVTLDDELATSFLKVTNGAKLGAETVNELAAMQFQYAETVTKQAQEALAEQAKTEWATTNEQWKEAAKTDPVIGGDKLQGVVADVQKFISGYDDAENLVQALEVTGAGNHPAFIRFVHSLVKDRLEGAKPPATGTKTSSERTLDQRLYG